MQIVFLLYEGVIKPCVKRSFLLFLLGLNHFSTNLSFALLSWSLASSFGSFSTFLARL